MENKYDLIQFHELVRKYRKYHSRLNKKIRNGTFTQLTKRKRDELVTKVQQLAERLHFLHTWKKFGAVASLALVLHAPSAVAQGPFELTTTLNPFRHPTLAQITFSGDRTEHVTFGDLDNDGDLDVIGGAKNEFRYFVNMGTASAPNFQERTGTDNPLSGITNEDYLAVNLADLDGDGDLDLLVGQDSGGEEEVRYLENTGTVTAPAFTERTGTTNPFDGVNLGDELVPFAVDIDDDADLDVFVGEEDNSQVLFFLNTGNSTNPVFELQTGTTNPFNALNPVASYRSQPTFADLDNDGDYDAVIGDVGDYYSGGDGKLLFYKNTGTAVAPVFELQTGTGNPFGAYKIVGSGYAFPSFADIDDDGDQDLFIGGEGRVSYFVNNGMASAPSFDLDVDLFTNVRLEFANIDANSDLELLVSHYDGIEQFDYTGTGFVEVTGGPFSSISGIVTGTRLVDLDNDGNYDLIYGTRSSVHYYRNTGTNAAPVYEHQMGSNNPFAAINFLYEWITVAAVDIDNDNDEDLFLVEDEIIHFYRNTGSPTAPAFAEETGTLNPLDGVNAETIMLAFTDLDLDGDFDLALGSREYDGEYDYVGVLKYYKNTGSVSSPVFEEQTGTNNPIAVQETNNSIEVDFYDIDGDADMDMFIHGDGLVYLYENKHSSVGVKEALSFTNTSVPAFPNPTKGDITLEIPSDMQGNAELTLSDLNGKVLHTEVKNLLPGNFRYEGLLASYEKGVYVLKLKMENRVAVTKLVKQ